MAACRLGFLATALCALLIPSSQRELLISANPPHLVVPSSGSLEPVLAPHPWLDAGTLAVWPRAAMVAGGEAKPSLEASPAASSALPAGARGDWRARVQQSLAEREYEASRNGEGLQAPNRAHNLRTYFEPTGIRVVDRTAEGSPELMSMRVKGWGRGDELVKVAPGEVTGAGHRVEIKRTGFVEWYENTAAGLEQGFTLMERPSGAGPVVLEMAVAAARLSQQGPGLALTAPGGRRLEYGGLEVLDADGKQLPARLEASEEEGAFRVVLEDDGARYPVTVDPLLTASGILEPNQSDAQLGASVAGAGDVNGDGYADVIVGAPLYDAGQTDEGAAFVFLGSASGVASGNPTTAAATLESNQVGASLGGSVAGAGDVNGDGYADVIVGAYYYDSGQTDEGAAFVFLGSAGGVASGNPTTAAATIQSNQAGALLSASVAGAGDVNGDGYADVIVGARFYNQGEAAEGAAFVFLGSAGGVASGNPTTAATTLQSNQVGGLLGYSVSSAGDVNGDGYADVIVGASFYDQGETDEGAAFVFLGSAGGVASGNPTTAAATLQSNQTSGLIGWSVASAGDVNGDGYADVIVGAPNYDAGQTDEGAAFVFLGSVTGVASGNPTTAGATLESNQANAFLGSSVGGAGDVNGNGYADVIVGAYLYDAGQTDEGAAFVFLGSAGGVASGNPTTAAATLESNQTTAYLGASVAGAGDVNGDGYADVIVGAYLYNNEEPGAAFVFLGSSSGVATGNPTTAAATLESNQSDAQLGASVAGAGDVNGDGYVDVIVGAPLYDAGQTDEGAAFVFLGSASGVASGNPTTAAATLESNQVGASLGGSVAGAGDVNGDGYADVIVGAYYYDSGQTDEGAAFVFLGSAGGVASGNPTTAAATIQSNQAGALLSASVAGAGDVNGDGYADVIVGARFYNQGEAAEGAAFVFLGSAGGVASGNPTTAATTLQSNQVGGLLGYSVSSAGDVNGDGYADVIVGAPFYDGGQTDEGAAFVFLGSAGGVASGDPTTAAGTLESNQANAFLGYSVAGAGDVNGDAYADVIVGSPFYDTGQTDEGAAFVFLGSVTGVASGIPTTAATTLESNQANAFLGWSVGGAGDVNGDGYADVIVGAYLYDAGQTDEGAAFVFPGSAGGVASGNPTTAAATLESNQATAYLGGSVAGAGDVNGDGYADVIVGAYLYNNEEPGAAFVFPGGGGGVGRPVLARQGRGYGVGPTEPVQPWGGSYVDGRFRAIMQATDPEGRGQVKLEAEHCPAGKAFGAPECGHYVSPTWQDVTATAGGVTFDEPISGLASSTLYHWRARVLHAPFGVAQVGITSPPKPAHGPWRRVMGQAVEADIRTAAAGVAVESSPLPVGALAIESVRPNPAPGAFTVSLALAHGGPARVELFDVAGRRVESHELKTTAAHRQTMTLGQRRPLEAGIYVVRLSQAGRVVTARVAILR